MIIVCHGSVVVCFTVCACTVCQRGSRCDCGVEFTLVTVDCFYCAANEHVAIICDGPIGLWCTSDWISEF